MATTTYATPPPQVTTGTTTSYLPLTTIFPSVPGCSSMFVQPNPATATTTHLFAFDPGYAEHINGTVTCVPTEVMTWWGAGYNGIYRTEIGQYSSMPCPAMYATAAILPHNSSTLIACCPHDYTYIELSSAPFPGQCSSVVAKGREMTFIQPDSEGAWTTTSKSWATDSAVYGVQINGWVFDAVTAASTETALTAGSVKTTTTAESSQAITSAESTETTAAASSSGKPDSQDRLSTGAKAGIGIGAALLGCLLLVIALWVLRKRKNQKQKMSGTTEGRNDPDWQTSELPEGVSGKDTRYHEVDSDERFEVPINHPRVEMP